jgi:hypothetical protein
MTDRLISQLVADLAPVRRQALAADAVIVAAACLLELAAFLLVRAQRADMPMAMDLAAFWWKLASLGLIALCAGGAALRSFDPTRSPRPGLRRVAVLVAVAVAAGWFIDASRSGGGALLVRLDWRTGVQCVAKMTALSLPALGCLGVLMRRGAATDRAGTALSVGLAGAAWGAFVFAFACPVDDPLYVAVWYGVGIGLITAATRLLLPALARW